MFFSLRRRSTPWLLVASLLFGLWTAAGHGDHAAGPASTHAHACAICVFAGGLGAGLVAAVALLVLGAAPAARVVAAVPATRAPSRRLRCARGPPSFLA